MHVERELNVIVLSGQVEERQGRASEHRRTSRLKRMKSLFTLRMKIIYVWMSVTGR